MPGADDVDQVARRQPREAHLDLARWTPAAITTRCGARGRRCPVSTRNSGPSHRDDRAGHPADRWPRCARRCSRSAPRLPGGSVPRAAGDSRCLMADDDLVPGAQRGRRRPRPSQVTVRGGDGEELGAVSSRRPRWRRPRHLREHSGGHGSRRSAGRCAQSSRSDRRVSKTAARSRARRAIPGRMRPFRSGRR